MRNIILDTLKDIWNNSVWSKVIAVIICAVGGSIFYYSNSIWYKACYVIILLIAAVLYIVYRYVKLKDDNANSIVLVDLHKPNLNQIETEPARMWDDVKKREYGNKGEGNYKIENGILNIERSNKEGRYILRFLSYND